MNFNKYLLSAATVAMTFGLSSCVKDLDVTPIDPNTIMEVDEPALYSKCYANMALAGNTGANGDCDIDGLDGGTTGFVRQMWNANELPTDEAICGWGDEGISAFDYDQWDASHPMLQGFYYRLYAGIDYCNHYLDVCAGVDATRSAEVRFLRCLYYYFLMDCWGNVPFATQISASSPEQISRANLFAWIESELKDADVYDKLLEPKARKSTDEGWGRADRNAADLLLARMYLNAEVYTGTAHWAEAAEYALKVINGPHSLNKTGLNGWSAYQMLFMGDNGETSAASEAILPLLQDGVTTTSWGTSLFLMASTWQSDMDVDGNYGTSEFWAGNRCRPSLLDKFGITADDQLTISEMTAKTGDARALFFGKDRNYNCTDFSQFTDGFSCGKFRNTYASGGASHDSKYVDMDYFLMRSAEAYLIYGEAQARSQSSQMPLSDGISYLNEIRGRAGLANKQTWTLDDILDERARELYFEGFRRTDLIRYGYFGGSKSSNYVWQWKGGAANGIGFEAYRNLYALPAEDVNANPNLTQNTGY